MGVWCKWIRSSKMHVCGIKADLMKKWPMNGVLVTSPSPLILAFTTQAGEL